MAYTVGTPVIYKMLVDSEYADVGAVIACTYESWIQEIEDFWSLSQPNSTNVVQITIFRPDGLIENRSNVSEGTGNGQFRMLPFTTQVTPS